MYLTEHITPPHNQKETFRASNEVDVVIAKKFLELRGETGKEKRKA